MSASNVFLQGFNTLQTLTNSVNSFSLITIWVTSKCRVVVPCQLPWGFLRWEDSPACQQPGQELAFRLGKLYSFPSVGNRATYNWGHTFFQLHIYRKVRITLIARDCRHCYAFISTLILSWFTPKHSSHNCITAACHVVSHCNCNL